MYSPLLHSHPSILSNLLPNHLFCNASPLLVMSSKSADNFKMRELTISHHRREGISPENIAIPQSIERERKLHFFFWLYPRSK